MARVDTVGLGTRLSMDVAAEFRERATTIGKTPSSLISQIINEWLSANADGGEYPLREQARVIAAALRRKGIEATTSGYRGHWRVVRLQEEGGSPDKQTIE